jgi:hypothetical protein
MMEELDKYYVDGKWIAPLGELLEDYIKHTRKFFLFRKKNHNLVTQAYKRLLNQQVLEIRRQ